MFRYISILGLGLMGGSVARAVRAYLPDTRITVMDSDPAALKLAREMQIADSVTKDAAEAVVGADLVLLAVPVDALEEVTAAIVPGLGSDTVVTDVASVKRLLYSNIAPLLPEGVVLVPAHPVAGSEKSGAASGTAMLFAGKRVILTPDNPETVEVAMVAEFWKKLRADIHYMPADLHDRIYACVSHLPQYISFVIKELFDKLDVKVEGDALAPFLRLGGSNPEMWEGIFNHNSDYIDNYLGIYLQLLHQLKGELREGAAEAQQKKERQEVCTELFPTIAASCMVHVAHLAERELRVPIKTYAGTGFTDFTSFARDNPESILPRISDHATAVASVLDEFAALLERRKYIS